MFQERPGPHPRKVFQVLHSFQVLLSRLGPWPYSQNIKLYLKGLKGTNTLAYFAKLGRQKVL
jgi:hypothetical protein